MPYLKIEFIPQFYMEPLLKKATHKYEDHVLRDIITLDLKHLWKKCEVNTHINLSKKTYWMIKGGIKNLMAPWINCSLKLLTRGVVLTANTDYIKPMPIFKLEANKLIALMSSQDMNGNVKTVDGAVWDLTDHTIIKIVRGGAIMKNLYVKAEYPKLRKSNLSF